MGKRFRLRISRIIPCGSNNNNNNNNNVSSTFSFARFSPATPTVVPKPKPGRPSSIKRHVSYALGSCGLTARSRPAISSDDDRDCTESQPKPTDHFCQWETEEKFWQVVEITETPRRKIYNSSADENDDEFDVVLPPLPPPPPPPPPSSAEKSKTTKRRVKHRKRKSHRPSSTRLGSVRLSTSSAESGLFTSESFDDDNETETLVSSSRISFSTDSSSYGQRRRRTKTTTNHKKAATKRCVSELDESAHSAPARLSVFQRMIPCTVAGKVRDSFAIVKRSDDPYEDFKSSMTEMILEKQMFEDEDLEQLLHCFLSLNSRNHHGDIVRAFIEIWEALFSVDSASNGSASARSCRRVSRALSLS